MKLYYIYVYLVITKLNSSSSLLTAYYEILLLLNNSYLSFVFSFLKSFIKLTDVPLQNSLRIINSLVINYYVVFLSVLKR